MSKIDNNTINSIKVLALDMINNAEGGHPGIVLGLAPTMYALYKDHLNVMPSKPDWINRDRLVLSCGHASALLYSTLYHVGYNLEMEELKRFRSLNSLTPGHPEFKVTPGVEVTTGPLGQGIANAVGMALAERYFNALVCKEKPKSKLIDYNVYCLCGDGDLMEGISYEALSFASTQNLDNLILIYDSNRISLDGETDVTFTEDIEIRFEALDFDIFRVKNGNNYSDISDAIKAAKKCKRPSIVIVETTIGKDSVYEGTNKAHATLLKKKDFEDLKAKLKVQTSPFVVDQNIINSFREVINKRISKNYQLWIEEYNNIMVSKSVKLHDMINLLEKNEFHIDFDDSNFQISDDYLEELRVSNNKIMNFISPKTPFFLGGAADVATSTKTMLTKSNINSYEDPLGKNICFGVREHAMAGILNGLSLSNLKVFGSTFLSFADYLKPGIRMSALMNLPVTYIFTHDSFYVGGDGPTHQPIEQLNTLRMIPNFTVFRPADINEIIGSWDYILKNHCATALVLSKEKRVKYKYTNAKFVKYGAYMIRKEKEHLHGIIIATGSEVKMALEIAKDLYTLGIDIRVVSMPSMELFLKQNPKYEEQLLPKNIPTFVIEAGNTIIWNRFASKPEFIFGINKFGQSATKEELEQFFKFNKNDILERIKSFYDKLIN